MDLSPKQPCSSGKEEKITSIIENLRLLTDQQLDIIHGFIENCVNKNLLDEVKSILNGRKKG